MYPVSDAFLQAVQENTRRYYWTGRIRTTAGTVHEFGEKDIVKGSGYISSQCCGNTEMELGTVYSSEMGITILSDIDRYTLKDALIELWYHLLVGDSYEAVPMGIFEISEANRSIKCLEIKAYDYMLRFDKNFGVSEVSGTAYDIISMCCKACKVTLAHSQAEIAALNNGQVTLALYAENDIETYRDVLFYMGQILGGFFCINRAGELELRKYGADPVMNISDRHRFSSSFSDFITRYTAVSSTNLKTQTAEYYGLDVDDGLTMNLGVNPFLQFGLKATRQKICEQILSDIGVINYVPFDSETIGNPALDLGDVIRFSGGHADDGQISCVTSSQIKIGGKHKLKCVGKNPKLAQAKSRNDKNISGLLNQVEAGKMGIHSFTNASEYVVGNTDTKIISIEFLTTEDNHALFFGQVLVDVAVDAVERTANACGQIGLADGTFVDVELPVSWQEDGKTEVYVTFEQNDRRMELHQPVQVMGPGRHILNLYYPIEDVTAGVANIFNVYLRTEQGQLTLAAGACIASITGQAMAAGSNWDGKIEISEKVTGFSIGAFGSPIELEANG